MRRPRLTNWITFVVLVLAVLAPAHELIYRVTDRAEGGYRAVLREAGHDACWSCFDLFVALACVALIAVSLIQLRRLTRQAAASNAGTITVEDPGLDSLFRLVGRLWVRVGSMAVLTFLIQENAETAMIGNAIPGLDAIASPSDPAVLVILGVAFVVSIVGALVRWRRDVLLARLRRAGHTQAAASLTASRVVTVVVHGVEGGRANGVRAPPLRSVVPI